MTLLEAEAQARIMAAEAQAAAARAMFAWVSRRLRRTSRALARMLTGEHGLLSR